MMKSQYNWIEAPSQELVAELAVPYLSNSPIILEAGCCNGEDTMTFKRIWNNCTIHGFEPNIEHFCFIKNLIIENTARQLPGEMNSVKKIYLLHEALSDKIGEVDFYISEVNSGASSLLPDNFANIEIPDSVEPDIEKKEIIKTQGYLDHPHKCFTNTIDNYFKDKEYPEMIWLDLEGHELTALRAGTSVLPSVKVIFIELNFLEFRKDACQFDQVNLFLNSHGFGIKYIWGNPEWQAEAMYVRN